MFAGPGFSFYAALVGEHTPNTPSETLCLKCGLCCNGVIFGDVRLQPGDVPQRLRLLGLPVKMAGSRPASFPQPCAALEGCRCRIYPDRPKYCRQFDCLLLKRLAAGEVRPPAAERVVARTLRQAEKVRKLLRLLGEHSEGKPLASRFRLASKRQEKAAGGHHQTQIYSELTLAFHELTLALGESFYPAPSE
jgi:hypothetical protein